MGCYYNKVDCNIQSQVKKLNTQSCCQQSTMLLSSWLKMRIERFFMKAHNTSEVFWGKNIGLLDRETLWGTTKRNVLNVEGNERECLNHLWLIYHTKDCRNECSYSPTLKLIILGRLKLYLYAILWRDGAVPSPVWRLEQYTSKLFHLWKQKPA